jgi:hypothetical protein
MSAAVAALTDERAVLHQRVADLEAGHETINLAWQAHVEDLHRAHGYAHDAARQRVADLERRLAECCARVET